MLRANAANRLQRHTTLTHHLDLLASSSTGLTPARSVIDGAYTCSFRHRRGLHLLVPSFWSPFLTVSAGTRIERQGTVGERQGTVGERQGTVGERQV